MPRDDSFEYKGFKKTGTATEDPNQISKVVAVLKTQKAASATRLAAEFIKIKEAKDSIDLLEQEFRDRGRGYVESLFDAEDAVWTRVVETGKVVMQISKASTRTTIKFDQEGFLAAILKIAPQLTDKMEKLKKAYTTETTIPVAAGFKASLQGEGIKEISQKTLEYLKNMGAKFLNYIKSWGSVYDDQLAEIEKTFKLSMPFESFGDYVKFKEIMNESE
jgi:hypothetical protein